MSDKTGSVVSKAVARIKLKQAKDDLNAGRIKFDPDYLRIKADCKRVLMKK